MQLEKRSINVYLPKINIHLRDWLPTKGNVLFTLLVIGSLLWAQNAGAISLGAPSAATTSITGIPYQGRLADKNGTPLTQTVNMTFRLYAVASGGSPLWTEQWTGDTSVQVSDGLFNVMLGSITPIPQAVITGNSNLFLGITVGTDSEMSPRVQLGSVPFATHALTVPDGSVTTAKIADGSVTSAKLAPDAQPSVKRSMVAIVRTLSAEVADTLHRWAATGTAQANLSFTVPEDYGLGDLLVREFLLAHDNQGTAKMARQMSRFQKSDGVPINLSTASADFVFPNGLGYTARTFTISAGSFAIGDLVRILETRDGNDPADTAGRLDIVGVVVEYTGK